MTYNELQNIAAKQRITLKDIAASMNLTPQGLRTSFVNQSFPIGKVLPLCKIIGISPNEFFGITATDRHNSQTAIGFANTNNSDLVILTLREELKQKNEQINSLLRLLPKPQ